MARHLIMDLKNVDIKVSGLEMVTPPKLSFKVAVELDKKIEKEASKDPLLQQEFQSQASEILDQTKKTIEQKCKVFDKLLVQMVNKGASEKDMKKQLDGLNTTIKNDMKVAALALSPLDGNSIATKSKDLALGVGGAAGGYVYDKITSKALDGTVFDAA